MEVMYKEVGKPAKKITIKGNLEDYQKLVGGYIQTFHLSDEVILVINEEGKLLNLPFNFAVPCHGGFFEEIVGNVVVCSVKPMDADMYGLEQEHLDFLEEIGFMDLSK